MDKSSLGDGQRRGQELRVASKDRNRSGDEKRGKSV